MTEKTYMSIGIPKGLGYEVDKIVKQPEHGFKSRNEFCVSAVRNAVLFYNGSNINTSVRVGNGEEPQQRDEERQGNNEGAAHSPEKNSTTGQVVKRDNTQIKTDGGGGIDQ